MLKCTASLLNSVNTQESHQASQVVVAVWVFFAEADGIPVALLCFLKLLQTVLNYTQIHPSCSKVRPAQIKKKKHKAISREIFGGGIGEMKRLFVRGEWCIPMCWATH